MGLWDEQAPGGGTPGMGPAPGGAPGGGGNPLMQLMQMIAARRAQAGQQQQGGGGTGSPGMAPSGQMAPPTVPTLPGTTPMPMPGGGPNVMGSPSLAGSPGPQFSAQQQPRQNEFATRSGKNAQVVRDAVGGIANVVGAFKQKSFQTNSAKAEQMWHGYLGLQQAMNEAQDPKAKQAIQQQLQQMTQDKTFIKTLEKAQKDPMSAEGIGLQRGIQAAQQDVARQLSMEQIQAKIQEAYAKAQSEAARQRYYEQKPQTDRDIAQTRVQGQKDVAQIHETGAAARTQTMAERAQAVAKMHYDAENKRTNLVFKAAEDRIAAMERIASGKVKAGGQGQKALDSVTKMYKSIVDSKGELDKQQKLLEDKLKNKGFWEKMFNKSGKTTKDPNTGETLPDPDSINEIDNHLKSIAVQRGHLEERLKSIDKTRDQLIQFGQIPAEAAQESVSQSPDLSGGGATALPNEKDDPLGLGGGRAPAATADDEE